MIKVCSVLYFLILSTSALAKENESILVLRDQFYLNQNFFSNTNYKIDAATKDKNLDLLNFQIEYTNCNTFNKRCSQSENAYKAFEKKYKTAPAANLLSTSELINQRQQNKLYSQVEMDFEYSVCQSNFNQCEKFQILRNQFTNKYKENPSLFDLDQMVQRQRFKDIKVEAIKSSKTVQEIPSTLSKSDLSKIEIKPLVPVDDVTVNPTSCEWDVSAIRPRLLSGSICTGAHKICFGKVVCGELSKYINCDAHLCDNPTACARGSLK